MRQFEYKTVEFRCDLEKRFRELASCPSLSLKWAEEQEVKLNELGKEGWELAHMMPGDFQQLIGFFKREIAPAKKGKSNAQAKEDNQT